MSALPADPRDLPWAPEGDLLPEEARMIAWLRPRSAAALHAWLLANPSAAGAGVRRDVLLERTRPGEYANEAPGAPPGAPGRSPDEPPAVGSGPRAGPARPSFIPRSGPPPRRDLPRSAPPDRAPTAPLPDLLPDDAPTAAPDRLPDIVASPGGAAAPSEAWWSAAPPGFDGPPAAERESVRIGPGAVRLDLTEGVRTRWPPRSQHGKPACVAFATAACVELMLAHATGTDPRRLSPMFVYSLVRSRKSEPLPGGWDTGATKLRQAAEVLERDGIPPEDAWPIARDAATPPDEAAVAAAAALLRRRLLYEDFPEPRPAPVGIARRIHAELVAGRPVAIALPEFADPERDGPTDWHTEWVVRTGEVTDPAPWARPRRGIGHAICIVGFQPAEHEALGGYFLFRNSWGTPWASTAPNGDAADAPFVPAPGYGTISASHVEAHCWELLSLAP